MDQQRLKLLRTLTVGVGALDNLETMRPASRTWAAARRLRRRGSALRAGRSGVAVDAGAGVGRPVHRRRARGVDGGLLDADGHHARGGGDGGASRLSGQPRLIDSAGYPARFGPCRRGVAHPPLRRTTGSSRLSDAFGHGPAGVEGDTISPHQSETFVHAKAERTGSRSFCHQTPLTSKLLPQRARGAHEQHQDHGPDGRPSGPVPARRPAARGVAGARARPGPGQRVQLHHVLLLG